MIQLQNSRGSSKLAKKKNCGTSVKNVLEKKPINSQTCWRFFNLHSFSALPGIFGLYLVACPMAMQAVDGLNRFDNKPDGLYLKVLDPSNSFPKRIP